MAEEMTKIDIEAIMADIRKNIEERGYEETDLKFAEVEVQGKEGTLLLGEAFQLDELSSWIVKMDDAKNVACWRPLGGNPVKTFIKKVIRKCIKWYVEPIVEEQNRYNHYTVCAMAQVFSKFAENQDARIKELEEQVEKLSKTCGQQLTEQIKEN